ncbi:MAG: inhibitor of cysteine peptidase [Methyloprofundus sp.]|nr:MAG: inhibitor of cysteine peptidase [Methyloprofundus sp.]
MPSLKPILFTILACHIPIAASSTAIAIGEKSTEGLAAISHELNVVGTTLLSSENIVLSFNIQVAAEDVGFTSELYLVAKIGDLNYIRNADHIWQAWDNNTAIIATQNLTLSTSEKLTVLDDNTLPPGEYLIYAGYKTRIGDVKYTESPTTLVVFAENSHNLHPVSHPEVLHDYLYQAAINSQNYFYRYNDIAFISLDTASPAAATTEGAATSISGTTLQEVGVDEGDRIKTEGDLLFALHTCANDLQQSCLHSYQLQANPAQATEMGSLQLTETEAEYNYYATKRLGELYLRSAQETSPRSLIWLSAENSWQPKPSEYSNWSAYDNKITIKFIDADNPAQLSIQQQLTIDGELLSSRLVDGVLYILSRYSSTYQMPYFFPEPILQAAPEVTQDNSSPIIKPPLDFFLPHYYSEDMLKQALVNSDACFIAPQNKDYYNQANLSVITAIPVNNPSAIQSRCIAGNLETFYASPNALYFATSRYPYTNSGTFLNYDYAQEQVTEVHKFSLQSAAMDYRGSGQATGHLGWDQEKKPFRFGEYQDTLRIATSAGNSWGIDSRTKITVLKEEPSSKSLVEVSTIDNLGKPGERLYAARFLGDRGYLVTFKQTDPLIVLDFSTPEAPVVLGELEINGYSDYLQPIGNHYLLGIGKDAVSDAANEITWYQGVKVALFDVSSAENLSEVNSLIIGKRGTDATVLHDHHGLALLASDANHYKLALPIELHDSFNKPYFGSQNNIDSIYYNWTHTGLYVFDIDLSGDAKLQLDGKLITESATSINIENSNYYDFLNDRAVIQNQTVHYIHGNKIISSEINNLQ